LVRGQKKGRPADALIVSARTIRIFSAILVILRNDQQKLSNK